MGAGGQAPLLPPPHAALPDAARRGADRPQPRRARATGSSSGSRCAGASWVRRSCKAVRASPPTVRC